MDFFDRTSPYLRLARVDKPVGILLLLWPTLGALSVAASGHPPLHLLATFILGSVLMRSAGCVANDLADERFDAHVTRTKHRPLASGAISRTQARSFLAMLLMLAALLLLHLNALTGLYALGASAVALCYPFGKRVFGVPQVVLGVAFSFGIPMAFAAVLDSVPAVAWWLCAANLFWVVGYDTAYAMVDRADDLLVGVKSSAITFGRYEVLASGFCFATYLGIFAALAIVSQWTTAFWLGWTGALGCVVDQYFKIRSRDPALCFQAFNRAHRAGLCMFTGLAVALT
ncbi:4-hydroxybenzoate octaprenyltransferase [Paraburkholderia piptadeniae]|uniref:4-hydroxybenzoate octaprenyltransferase n=1 Tax=Paraburkholderia piptadeniae TaxID=1701573 RepID=A0A1N7RW05_9BURK|nr:4-hydroxybenzoate octaprenyltransferase [Paraburkholderia piptadeniae]SIT39306.1 4-hydroxybenzoate octaprenyltransferase [Paraburkholderia piptadeniae]